MRTPSLSARSMSASPPLAHTPTRGFEGASPPRVGAAPPKRFRQSAANFGRDVGIYVGLRSAELGRFLNNYRIRVEVYGISRNFLINFILPPTRVVGHGHIVSHWRQVFRGQRLQCWPPISVSGVCRTAALWHHHRYLLCR